MMPKIYLCLCFLLICHFMLAFSIEFRSSDENTTIQPTVIEDYNYYSLNDLRTHLKTVNHYIDYENGKVTFSIFDASIVIYINSFFVSSRGKLSNLSYPVIHRNGDFYLPETFFSRSLIEFFPDKFSWNNHSKVLSTEKPHDRRINTIVIDPGHGGRDPGAVGKRTQEKVITLDVAKKLKTQLEKELGVNVILTRSTDEFVSLQERTNIANQNKANLFISLHTNGARSRNAHGVEVYIYAAAQTNEERAVAAFENSVVELYEGGLEAVKAYDDLQFILADLLQSEQHAESTDLAVRLQTELINVSNQLDRGVKQANFYVLRGAFMPAVLIELGFITNEAEETKLMNKDHQEKLVTAITSGIASFKLKYEYLW